MRAYVNLFKRHYTSVELLYRVEGQRCEADYSTHTADSAGDLNGDGVPELMFGKTCAEQVVVVDGKTGDELFTLDSPDPVNQGYFGMTLRLLPDMTGDGKPDWLIHQLEPQSRLGRVYIFDSQTREVVRTIQNTEAAYKFHMEHVEVIPDVDRDGKPELLVGSRTAPVQRNGRTFNNAGRAIVRSLQTGQVLYELLDPEPKAEMAFGTVSGAIGDITGDGIGDIAIGDFRKDDFAGIILLFSGADGAWLRTVRSPNPRRTQANGGRFGRRIESLPDLNGDGVPELWTQEEGTLLTHLYDGATSVLLKTIKYPGKVNTAYGGPKYFVGTVRQEAPPGLRAYLFFSDHIADFEGRVYFMPFTPLPKPPQLKPLGASNTGFRLQVIGEPGIKAEVQGTGDFKTWVPVATVTIGTDPVGTEDSAAANHPQCFYRAVQKE